MRGRSIIGPLRFSGPSAEKLITCFRSGPKFWGGGPLEPPRSAAQMPREATVIRRTRCPMQVRLVGEKELDIGVGQAARP